MTPALSAWNPTPASAAMIESVLRWRRIDPGTQVATVSERMLQMVNEGQLDRDFLNWCRSPESPPFMAALEKNWARLLFTSFALATYAHGHHIQAMKVSSFMPFWKLSSMTKYCAPHAKLDGVVARFDDPVWQFILPPNGWCCACLLESLDGSEPEMRAGLRKIVSPEMKQLCTLWLDEEPDRLLKFF